MMSPRARSTAPLYLVRAGPMGNHITAFLSESIVAIGWPELGPLSEAVTDDALRTRFEAAYPDVSQGTRTNWRGQVRRFLKEIVPGSDVATYDSRSRTYVLGTVTGAVRWRAHELPRARAVLWTHIAERDNLTPLARRKLGAINTLFRVHEEAVYELRRKALPMASSEEQTRRA